jgi:hypothetical protein
MKSADVAERADFFKYHYPCIPEQGIIEELFFEHAAYQDILNRTQPSLYLNGLKSRIFIWCVQTLM